MVQVFLTPAMLVRLKTPHNTLPPTRYFMWSFRKHAMPNRNDLTHDDSNVEAICGVPDFLSSGFRDRNRTGFRLFTLDTKDAYAGRLA